MADIKRIGIRHDTDANWQAENPTLLTDETIIVDDTYEIKRGTGDTYDQALDVGNILPEWKIIKLSIQYSHQLGELLFLDDHYDPVEFSESSPADFFPALDLSAVNKYDDLSDSNWPDLVPHLRGRPLYYERGKTGEKYQFDVTEYDVTSGVATLTFNNAAPENTILAALQEDNLEHGDYSNWRSITPPSSIGTISAGDYTITNVDTVNRQIQFSTTDSDGSGSVTAVASFYPHRIAGSTTTARIFEATGEAIMSANNGDRISGLRQRDQMQRITGSTGDAIIRGSLPEWDGEGAISQGPDELNNAGGSSDGHNLLFNSANSPNARTSGTTSGQTRSRNISGHLYIWGRDYVA